MQKSKFSKKKLRFKYTCFIERKNRQKQGYKCRIINIDKNEQEKLITIYFVFLCIERRCVRKKKRENLLFVRGLGKEQRY